VRLLGRSRTPEPTLTAERWFLSVYYRNPYTVAIHASWGICSITQKKKSVVGCSIPNRFSLEAT
jgi:hypothetical protein